MTESPYTASSYLVLHCQSKEVLKTWDVWNFTGWSTVPHLFLVLKKNLIAKQACDLLYLFLSPSSIITNSPGGWWKGTKAHKNSKCSKNLKRITTWQPHTAKAFHISSLLKMYHLLQGCVIKQLVSNAQ